MADFHTYTMTITVKLSVAADGNGNPTTFNTGNLGPAVKALLAQQLGSVVPAIEAPVVAISGATPVTV